MGQGKSEAGQEWGRARVRQGKSEAGQEWGRARVGQGRSDARVRQLQRQLELQKYTASKNCHKPGLYVCFGSMHHFQECQPLIGVA